jgi:hypothetical protein
MIEPSLSSASPAAPAGTYNVLQEEGGNTANRRKKHYLYVHSTNNPLSRVSTYLVCVVIVFYYFASLFKLFDDFAGSSRSGAQVACPVQLPFHCRTYGMEMKVNDLLKKKDIYEKRRRFLLCTDSMNGMESFPPFLDTLLGCIPRQQDTDNTDRLNSFLKRKKRQITAVEEQVISVGYVIG